MLCQTIDNLMPLLQLLQQPAFCVRADGTLTANPAAAHLFLPQKADLPCWLGAGLQLWESWDRTAALNLSLTLHNQPYNATVQALQDGTLFLLNPDTATDHTAQALAVASQVLRQPLTDLSAAIQQFSNQSSDLAAMMNRQIYRLTRLTGNLADLAELHSGKYRLRPELLDINPHFDAFMREVSLLCREAGRVLEYTPLAKSSTLQADPMLLERALLNLISNALKFSQKGTPIQVRTELSGNYLLFKVSSQCPEASTDLLRTAFSRLEERGLLPDPSWGIGLGLPICQAVARLHGGMVAVEVSPSNIATITLAITRHRPSDSSVFNAPPPFSYTGGMRRTLVELADVLPSALYQKDAL